MKAIIILISFITLSFSLSVSADNTKEMINSFYSDASKDSVNDTVCKHAIKLGKGKVTKETCKSSLPEIHETCSNLALTYFGKEIKTPQNARKLIDTIISCAIVLQLDYEAYLTEEGVRFKPINM